MRCEYAHDDGAYVLGALAPAERSAYERHLATCPACREAVAEIAVLPGLLGRLDPATALQLLTADEPAQEPGDSGPWPVPRRDDGDDARMTSLLRSVTVERRKERRRSRFRYAGTALVAACLALIAMLGVGMLRGDLLNNRPDPGTDVRMEAMTLVSGQIPVTASIGLESRSWGTEVTMECAYEATDRYRKAWQLHLLAYGPDSQTEQVGSWIAAPGKPVTFKGATRFAGDQLVRLALTRADGTPLLIYDVP